MHPAKKFFYVCAGLFLLALSYHLGGANANASMGALPVAPAFYNGFLSFVIDRTYYNLVDDGTSFQPLAPIDAPVPGSSAIVATMSNGGGNYVLLANGDTYVAGNGADWVSRGNVISGGPVNVQRHTLGQLKQLYRPGPTGK